MFIKKNLLEYNLRIFCNFSVCHYEVTTKSTMKCYAYYLNVMRKLAFRQFEITFTAMSSPNSFHMKRN